MLANSYRFVRATMALEVVPVGTALVREEFRLFARDVEKTLDLLTAALRGEQFVARRLPDLREDHHHHRLVHSADSEMVRYSLVNEETDRMTNSLNTLREQVSQWEKMQ